MIISRTPYRVSFFGGGTDYPIWYERHGGEVLGASINQYCYLTCRKLPAFYEHKFRIIYSKIETCQTLHEIKHPAVREVLRYFEMEEGLEIHHDGDLPARSGIGSSSSFTVGLLHALYALHGKETTPRQLAEESIYLEQKAMRETVGSQDQILAACGGLNHVRFKTDGSFEVHPVLISESRIRELESNCMLFFTRKRSPASEIAQSYVPLLPTRVKDMKELQGMTGEALRILTSSGDLRSWGELLHESWKIKSSLSERITDESLNAIYQRARNAGALGGKITGAGGGGFLLLFAPPEAQPHIRKKLAGILEVPFRLDFSGSRIIFSDQEVDREAVETLKQSKPEFVAQFAGDETWR